MNTAVTFLMEEKMKKRAQLRAKEEGLSLKAVIVMSLKAYSDGKLNFGAIDLEPEIEKVEFYSEKLDKKAKELEKLLIKLDKKGLLKKSLEDQLADV